ncbi:MAG: dephospho-CoA kinase [Bacteroidota bacterium]|nr:MAG: dephospho-CoA kinase [Bacteroidota bacterium]
MLRIGITGGIGSGKSYICEIFRKIGVPVYESDIAARQITDKQADVKKAIEKILGAEAYQNGYLNRPYVASMVFQNSALLQEINSIIHPAVEKDFQHWCLQQNQHQYVINEAAILFESGAYKMLDKTIVVSAPIELRIERTMNRNGFSREEIERRMQFQWPAEKIETLADFIIVNDNKKLLLPQIIKIDKTIQALWQNLVNG